MKIKGFAAGTTFIIINGIESITRGKNLVYLRYQNNERGVVINADKIDLPPTIDSNTGDLIVPTKSSAGLLVEKIIKEFYRK